MRSALRNRNSPTRRLTGLTLAIATCVAAFLTAQASISASASSNRLQTDMQPLNLDLVAAGSAGYAEADLQPILDRQAQLAATPVPLWPGDRPAYLQRRALEIADLRGALHGIEIHRLELLHRTAVVQLGVLSDGLARDARLGVDESELQPLVDHARLAQEALGSARTPTDYTRVFTEIAPVIAQADELNAQQAAQLAAVETRATSLAGQGLAVARKAGLDALESGRNDATLAAFIYRPDVGRAYDRLERTARRLDGAEIADVALAAALMERYRDEVHATVLKSLPAKLIVTSIAAQQMWVYWNSQLWIDTLVTTGRPALPTNVGLMVVARKESPVHFISPFPKGSAYDYGTADANYALWISPDGEAIHDSWWRSWYGPGSNVADYGSHGCIGMQRAPIDRLFPWADLGTPVVVIPGDGGTPASQLAQRTYEDPYWTYHSLPAPAPAAALPPS